jgi:hypothetical protein
MGMPTDTVSCTLCGASKTVWGDNTVKRIEDWARKHECPIIAVDSPQTYMELLTELRKAEDRIRELEVENAELREVARYGPPDV